MLWVLLRDMDRFSHILFVDDVLIIGGSSLEEWKLLHSLLLCFCKASGLEVSPKKSFLLYSCMDATLKSSLLNLFPFNSGPIEEGFKYLGFVIKPNGYGPKYWKWMMKYVSRKINSWAFRYLSLGGRMVLIELVLQGIHVY